MPRSYHVAAASVALGCEPKWLDNILSRYRVHGVTRERQGIARQVSADALLRLAVARALVHDLAVPIPQAIALGHQLADAPTGDCVLPSGLVLRVDVTRVRREIDRRLLESAELSVPPRRGRPPAKAKA